MNKEKILLDNISKELDHEYNSLVYTMSKLSPVNWDKLYFLGWIDGNTIEGNFWIKFNNGIIHPNQYIRIRGNSEREKYFDSIAFILLNIKVILLKYKQEMFTQIMFTVDESGDFEVDYSYNRLKKDEYFSKVFIKWKDDISQDLI